MPRNWVSIDKMKYKNDSLAFTFSILGLLANVLYFFTLYQHNDNYYYSYLLGISVIYNLIFMLAVFLAGEEVKTYHRNYAYVLLALGIVQILRIFFYPRIALNAGKMEEKKYWELAIMLAISGIMLILGAIRCFRNTTLLKLYKEGKLKVSPTDEV
ncbi:MAG TPA: hypothetical protein VIK96_05020 [Bacilli bacterium]